MGLWKRAEAFARQLPQVSQPMLALRDSSWEDDGALLPWLRLICAIHLDPKPFQDGSPGTCDTGSKPGDAVDQGLIQRHMLALAVCRREQDLPPWYMLTSQPITCADDLWTLVLAFSHGCQHGQLWRACQGERVCEHPCLRDREHRRCWLRLSCRTSAGCSNCYNRCGMV
ncbi:MAG TPA: hypothetical protein VGF67_02025 [Ktedonobacteraceae bacterium]